MLQSRQDNLFACFLNLPSQKHLVQDGVDLVKVEDEVQLANIAKKLIENLDEKVNGLEVGKLVVIGVDANTEEQTRVPAIDNLCGGQVLPHEGLRVVRG